MPNRLVTGKEMNVEFKKIADAFNARFNSTIHRGKQKKAVPAKPRKRVKLSAVRIMKDGRHVCRNNAAGKREYSARTQQMVERQNNWCSLGIHRIVRPTFEHEDLRGLGGGRRDDRIEVNGKWQNSAACWSCNGKKGSKRCPKRTF